LEKIDFEFWNEIDGRDGQSFWNTSKPLETTAKGFGNSPSPSVREENSELYCKIDDQRQAAGCGKHPALFVYATRIPGDQKV
jgi:hypothetical protein